MALHQAQVTEVSNTAHNSSAVDVAKHKEQRKGHLSSASKASKIVRVILSQSRRSDRIGGSSRGTSSKDR